MAAECDDADRLHHEAVTHRVKARHLTRLAATCADPIKRLQYRHAASERLALAKEADQMRRQLMREGLCWPTRPSL